MYFAPISQATKYNYLDDKFQAAYKWLAETDLDNTPAGSYPICEGVTANVQEYTTFPASEGSFETHDKFSTSSMSSPAKSSSASASARAWS